MINKKKENKNNEKRELGGGGENRELDCRIAQCFGEIRKDECMRKQSRWSVIG